MTVRPTILGGAAHAHFTLPRSSLWHLHEIIRDYECGPGRLPRFDRPQLLDIGAHVGAWSLWALSQWPDATIDAYEPHPMLARMLAENVAGERVTVHECAVLGGEHDDWVSLYEGRRTLLGNSTVVMGWQRTDERPMSVRTLPAAELPACDVLKIDIEGAELPVLVDYPHRPRVVMGEWHCSYDAERITDLLRSWGMEQIKGSNRGVCYTGVWVQA